MAKELSITLGPTMFNWPADMWSDFYARIADEAPVDRVCLGEVVCSKRLPFYADRIPEAVERLQRAGKQVILSSLALVTTARERRLSAELSAETAMEVEVNDLTALAYLGLDARFSVGPLVNTYNEGTLAFLAQRGAVRICLPPELPLTSVVCLAESARAHDVDVEVWGFGRVPLAISGRCYHARVHRLAKDSCQFVCEKDHDGLLVETVDRQEFLAVNGVQTLSSTHCSLLGDVPSLQDNGISSIRLSPQTCDMVALARLFRDVADGVLDVPGAEEMQARLLPSARFSNGFLVGACGAA